MQVTIKLTESEIKKAVLEYLENSTTLITEINHSDITVKLTCDENGDATAEATFEETLDTEP